MVCSLRRVIAAALALQVVSLGSCDSVENCNVSHTFNTTSHDPYKCTLRPEDVLSITFEQLQPNSSFVVQAHTFPSTTLTLTQTSNCEDSLSCTANGSNIGLVGNVTTSYSLTIASGSGVDGDGVAVLIAAVVNSPESPIPGGCAQTSHLADDPMITTTFTGYSYSTLLTFNRSSAGHGVTADVDSSCSARAVDKNITYTLYSRCVNANDFSQDSLFDAIKAVITQDTKHNNKLHDFTNDEPTRVTFDTTRGKGVVFNVLARYNGQTPSPYVPVVSYSCDFSSDGSGCRTPVVNYVFAVLLCLVGLFLCFLGHRYFHAEILLLSAVISSYVVFFILNAATRGEWPHTILLCSSVAIAVLPTLLLFLVWFFTGYYFFFVTLFGACMGYVLIATLLFTPLVKEWSWFSVSYVYILIVLLGMLIAVLPLLVFPRVQNIWCTSVLGGYCVIFSLGAITYSRVPDIVLKPANNAAIDGYIKAQFGCPFDIVDFALCSLWAFLISLGIIVQTVLTTYEERKFNKKQTMEMTEFHKQDYSPFPAAPYKLIKRYLKKRRGTFVEQRPLLSPSTSVRINYGPHS